MSSETNSSETSGGEKWYSKAPWGKIILYLVLGLMIIGAIKAVSTLLNGTGPLTKGMGQLMGAGANVINTVVNGCKSQPDCSKEDGQTEKQCTSMSNCTWAMIDKDPDKDKDKDKPKEGYKKIYRSDEQTPTCFPSNGVKPGNKISSVGCAFFWGLFVSLGAFLLSGPLIFLGRFLRSKRTNRSNEVEAKLTGKSETEIAKDRERVGREALDIVRKTTENDGYTDKQLVELGKAVISECDKLRAEGVARNASGESQKEAAEAEAEAQATIAKDVQEETRDALAEGGATPDAAEAGIDKAKSAAESVQP